MLAEPLRRWFSLKTSLTHKENMPFTFQFTKATLKIGDLTNQYAVSSGTIFPDLNQKSSPTAYCNIK